MPHKHQLRGLPAAIFPPEKRFCGASRQIKQQETSEPFARRRVKNPLTHDRGFALSKLRLDGADKSWLLYLFPPFIAVGFSSRQSLYPTLAADLFHGKSFGAIIGALSLFIGAGAGIGPWLGGLIYDWTGSYREAFWVAQAAGVAAFVWIAGARELKRE